VSLLICGAYEILQFTTVGYPIRRSPGELHGSYPGLIAALRVLHRLLMPRHPLCALVIFNQSLNLFASCPGLNTRTSLNIFSVCVQFSKNSPDLFIPAARVVGLIGLEPMTPALSRRCSNQLSYRPAGRSRICPLVFAFAKLTTGGKGIRTPDIQLAKLALYQLSYTPVS
jgi:hypothetical protein